LTHGHPDHSGGLLNPDGTQLFPNAMLVMGQDDWDLWTSPHPNWADFCCPKILDQLLPLVQLGLRTYNNSGNGVYLVGNNETYTLLPGFTIRGAGGHTSLHGHMIAEVMSQGQTLHVLGDSFFTPLHMEKTGYGCTHDHHRQVCIDTRAELTSTFQPDDVLYAMHFAFPGLGQFDSNTNTFTHWNSTQQISE